VETPSVLLFDAINAQGSRLAILIDGAQRGIWVDTGRALSLTVVVPTFSSSFSLDLDYVRSTLLAFDTNFCE